MNLKYSAMALAVLLAACSSTTSQKFPAGSMLTKSFDDWKAYHNSRPEQKIPCDATTESSLAPMETFDVDATHVVVALLCNAGAYQSAYVFYNVMNPGPQETVVEMSFDIFDDNKKRTRTPLLTDPVFNEQKKTLFTLNKQRGAADCGTAATYEWREDVGGFFDLVEFRQKLNCDGKATDFPVIYTRTEKQPAEGQMPNKAESDSMMKKDN